MRARLQPRQWQAALLVAGLVAACQPLPHPFAEDRPPASLMTVRDDMAVTVAPIDGEPAATATKLGTAVARALRDREIPATEKTTSLGSYQLYGRIEESPAADGKTALVAHWRLRDPQGQPLGERSEQVEASAQAWKDAEDAPVSQLASASAAALAGLLQEEPPVEAAGAGRTRLLIRKIAGASGDGGKSLSDAMAAALKGQDVELVSDPAAKVDLYLDAEVAIAPAKNGKQDVKIVWHVRHRDGSDVGTVGQENEVPTGLLSGPWGDVAYMIAMSAQSGIMALVDRGAPAAEGKS